jgi:uncharacterized protein (UPF0335 family)
MITPLPEPDFALDMGDEPCYYAHTVAALLAAKDAEIARLKTVPMRYRRMAFNAQLQEENKALSTKVRTLERKARKLTTQRDKAIGRTRELQGYVTKYQREIVQLKKKEVQDARQKPD